MKDSAPIIAYFTKDTASFAILQEDIKWFNENFKQPLFKYFLKLTDNFLQKPDKNFKEIKPENDDDHDRCVLRES
ncbi:MAG: hypothetical protein JWP78_3355 [Mucilaginibacter sp.]|nr:hypothetical protein [Mucilaginibacter sp.]